MGRELQKKKGRSSLQKVKPKRRDRTKAGKKKVNFLGNEIIARNWDRKLTMSQNYNRLGLSSRLNAATGGIERKARNEEETEVVTVSQNPLAIPSGKPSKELVLKEARVARDPETGHILRIIQPKGAEEEASYNPLNDSLNILNDEEENPVNIRSTGVIRELEAQAADEADQLARTKKPRQQSQRESEWIESLVKRHGDNIMAMVQDRKLNPMQQSKGDIFRRIKTWNASRGAKA